MMMMLNLINHPNTQFIQNIIINTYLPGTKSTKSHKKKIFKKMVINVPRFLEIHGP
jgi:hypothetical protein